MTTLVMRFFADDTGATAIEYGLIAAGIAVAIIATVQALGTNLNSTFSSVVLVVGVVERLLVHVAPDQRASSGNGLRHFRHHFAITIFDESSNKVQTKRLNRLQPALRTKTWSARRTSI